MGLIVRLRYVYDDRMWRLRYWWLDTRQGEIAHVGLFVFSLLVLIGQMVRLAVAALVPPPPDEPVKAVYWWVVQLVILVVSAAITYALRPKTEPPKPMEGDAPVSEDGTAVTDYFGTCWIDDPFVLAWKMTGTDPIRTKGGKK